MGDVAGTSVANEPQKVEEVAANNVAGRTQGTSAADGRGGRRRGTRGKRGTSPRRVRGTRGRRPCLWRPGGQRPSISRTAASLRRADIPRPLNGGALSPGRAEGATPQPRHTPAPLAPPATAATPTRGPRGAGLTHGGRAGHGRPPVAPGHRSADRARREGSATAAACSGAAPAIGPGDGAHSETQAASVAARRATAFQRQRGRRLQGGRQRGGRRQSRCPPPPATGRGWGLRPCPWRPGRGPSRTASSRPARHSSDPGCRSHRPAAHSDGGARRRASQLSLGATATAAATRMRSLSAVPWRSPPDLLFKKLKFNLNWQLFFLVILVQISALCRRALST